MLEKSGKIKDLELQKEYVLQDNFKLGKKTIRAIKYCADFVYYDVEEQKTHVVDVKGYRTEVYRIKKKMFEYKYGIELEEI